MDEKLGIAIINDKVAFFTLVILFVLGIIAFFIGLKKGWWILKSKKGEITGQQERAVREVAKNEALETQKERDRKWYNVLALQSKLLQELDDKKVDIRHNCLVRQLGYIDDTFDSEETSLRLKLSKDLDRKNEKVQLAEYRFESTFHKTKREIIQVVKDNNLLQQTPEELKEKIRKRAKKNTDYFRKDAPFYPIKIDEKVVEEYSDFVETAAEQGIMHARELAEQREKELVKLYDEYEAKIAQIIQDEIPDVATANSE